MYAIIKTGGKQYRVQQGDELRVEKLDAKEGDKVVFDEVVAVGGDKLVVGTPFVEGYAVTAEVLTQGKGDKVVIYKYKAKKDYRRKNGHRQPFTLVKITDIGGAGKKAAKKADKAEKPAKAESPAKKEEKAAAPKVSASMKKDELLAVAKEMGVKVDSKATKADIIAAIEAK
ncbi:MAG: 50S ribosomal protein L21 [Mogibacterium sp.]|jgi:large subunit ribosomal protein L21|nr:50S ribosomal protein L21 [Mogibacterium sp.]MBR0380569.1 50S ribosomal protein L21 [Mogibacterium sp.]